MNMSLVYNTESKYLRTSLHVQVLSYTHFVILAAYGDPNAQTRYIHLPCNVDRDELGYLVLRRGEEPGGPIRNRGFLSTLEQQSHLQSFPPSRREYDVR